MTVFCRYLYKFYWYNPYFYTSIFKILYLIVESNINKLGRYWNKNYNKKLWRKRNRLNSTTISSKTDMSRVFVGSNSEGNIDATFTGNPNEILIIEENVKIEDGVKFVFGSNELILIKKDTIIPAGTVVN